MLMSDDATVGGLRELASLVKFRFPITSKDDFKVQMMRAGGTVHFREIVYDTKVVANLIPAFFFPINDLNELLKKSTELLLSRGLLSDHDVDQ